MALPHAILVPLCEQAGSGYELDRRFDRSIGYFWAATHQQIYRTLRVMEDDGWVHVKPAEQQGRPDKKVCRVTVVDDVIICAGRESVRDLEDGLRRNGIEPHVIGGAAAASTTLGTRM